MHATTVYLFVLLFDIVSEQVCPKQGQGPKQVVYLRFYMYMNEWILGYLSDRVMRLGLNLTYLFTFDLYVR